MNLLENVLKFNCTCIYIYILILAVVQKPGFITTWNKQADNRLYNKETNTQNQANPTKLYQYNIGYQIVWGFVDQYLKLKKRSTTAHVGYILNISDKL